MAARFGRQYVKEEELMKYINPEIEIVLFAADVLTDGSISVELPEEEL